jgi:hypothetical protein
MNQKTLLSLIAVATTVTFSSCTNNGGDNYPVAKPMVDAKTGDTIKDHYVSPFRPYNPIVAKGFKSGQVAGDPSTIKTDPDTGKPDKSSMKIFKLP